MNKKEKKEQKRIENEQKEFRKINFDKLHKSYYFRDFEIEMYWKRAQYFWSFLAVIYAGYFLLLTYKDIPAKYKLITAAIGVLMSFSWYLVNRGSKRWQEHWEKMIDKYEDITNFIVYKDKTTINTGIIKAGAFSVSKINIMVSLIIFLSWIYIFGITLFENQDYISMLIGLITLVLITLIGFLSKSQS